MRAFLLRSKIALRLTASTAMCALMATVASAQEVTPYRFVDANGVDLVTGSHLFKFEEGSIGAGQDRLVLSRNSLARTASEWDNLRLSRNASGIFISSWYNSSRWTWDAQANAFTNGLQDGAKLVKFANGYTLIRADGSTITFGLPASDSYRSINMCYDGNARDCVLLPLELREADGRRTILSYDVYTMRGPEFDVSIDDYVERAWWRLTRVSRSSATFITFEYQSNALPVNNNSGQRPSDQWLTRSAAVFGNTAARVEYSYPGVGSVTVRDAMGNDWQMTGSFPTIAIRPPGTGLDRFVLNYNQSTGTVASVTQGGVTTSYARSVSGTTATMTVTFGPNEQMEVVSELSVGRPTRVTDANNRTTLYRYDAAGRLDQMTMPDGRVIEYTLDSRGNTTRETRRAGPGGSEADIVTEAFYPAQCDNVLTCNQPLATKDARGNQTDFTYDPAHGGVLTVTAPAQANGIRPQTRYGYRDSFGVALVESVSRCRTTASCAGGDDETRVVIDYDSSRQPNRVTVRSGTGALASSTALGYDSRGNVTSIDGPLGGSGDTIFYRYDAARRLIGVIAPHQDGDASGARRAERQQYRADGLVDRVEIGTVDGSGDTDWQAFQPLQWQSSEYDGYGRIRAENSHNSAGIQMRTEYSHDGRGRLECTALRMNQAAFGTAPGACVLGTEGSFGPDRITRRSYNAGGELTSLNVAVGTQEAATDMTIAYTSSGDRASVTDGNGNLTAYSYDGHGRLRQTSYPSKTNAGTTAPTDFEQLSYDAAGNVVTRRLRDGLLINYAYDNLDRLTYKNLPGGEPDVAYEYDNLGHRTYTNDSAGNFVRVTYDALGRPTAQATPLGVVGMGYDAAGRRVRLDYPGGFWVQYGYNTLGELRNIAAVSPGNVVTQVAGYRHDVLGRRDYLTRGNQVPTGWAWDGLSRLSSLTHDLAGVTHDVTTVFSYNPAGQIDTRVSSSRDYAFTALPAEDRVYGVNGLNQIKNISPSETLGNSARGNLASITSGNTTRSYLYTAENRLRRMTVTGTQPSPVVDIGYDPLGRLYQLSSGGSVTKRYLYDGDRKIAEYNGAGTLLRRYVLEPDGDTPVAWFEGPSGNSNVRFYVTDERGSVQATTDAANSAGATDLYAYDEFGVPAAGNDGLYQYTGQAWIAELGLYDYKARMYAPKLGRFLQPDPIGYSDGMNLYGYVGGDPVNGVDPTGLSNDGGPNVVPGSLITVTASPGNGAFLGVQFGSINGIGPIGLSAVLNLSISADTAVQSACNAGNCPGETDTTSVDEDDEGVIVITASSNSQNKWLLHDGRYTFNKNYIDPAPWLNLTTFIVAPAVIATLVATAPETGPAGMLFGRARYRNGSPGIFNAGKFRVGWSWDNGGWAGPRNYFGVHGGQPGTPQHWHFVPIPGPRGPGW